MAEVMAQPLPAAKKAVDLAGGVRRTGSRIRRAPPPGPEKKLTAAQLRERELWVVVTGMIAVALALALIMLAVARWGGWSPRDYVVVISDRR